MPAYFVKLLFARPMPVARSQRANERVVPAGLLAGSASPPDRAEGGPGDDDAISGPLASRGLCLPVSRITRSARTPNHSNKPGSIHRAYHRSPWLVGSTERVSCRCIRGRCDFGFTKAAFFSAPASRLPLLGRSIRFTSLHAVNRRLHGPSPRAGKQQQAGCRRQAENQSRWLRYGDQNSHLVKHRGGVGNKRNEDHVA